MGSENETPSREYDLRAPGITSTFEVVEDHEPVTVKFEWDQLIVPHKEGSVTLDMLKEFVFEDEDVSYSYDIADLDDLASGSCVDLVENEDLKWSCTNKAEEYLASFGVSQFGIKLVDSGL